MKLFKKDATTKKWNMRRLRFGTASTIFTIAAIVIVLLLNIVMDIVEERYPITWDLSAEKSFSLSEDSIKIADSITTDVEVIVFAAESNIQNPTSGEQAGVPEFDTTMREFYNVLREYRNRTNGKIDFQFVDPNQEKTKFDSYSDYKVASGDILFLSGERNKLCSIADLYTVEMDQSGYSYTFSSKVEQTLASNFYSLQTGNDRVVQVLVGRGEDENVINGLKVLYELNGYTFEEINISSSAEFNEKAEVMLIAAPIVDYKDDEIKRVQEWVFNKGAYGRHLIVYTHATADCPNLYEFLDVEYSIQVTDQILKETNMNRYNDQHAYKVLTDVPTTNFTANSVGTGKVYTPFARRLTTTLSSEKSQANAIGAIAVPMNNYPKSAQIISLDNYLKNQHDQAYHLNDADYPMTSMIAWVMDSYDNNTQQEAYGTVVVSGCPSMAYSENIRDGSLNNEELLLDAINSVTGHENSVTITNKVLETNYISFEPTTQLILGIGVFTVGLPVIVLLICLVIFLRRKNL